MVPAVLLKRWNSPFVWFVNDVKALLLRWEFGVRRDKQSVCYACSTTPCILAPNCLIVYQWWLLWWMPTFGPFKSHSKTWGSGVLTVLESSVASSSSSPPPPSKWTSADKEHWMVSTLQPLTPRKTNCCRWRKMPVALFCKKNIH